MEITKMLTISNGHVSDGTWQKLAREASAEFGVVLPMSVYEKGNYGFFVCCASMVDIIADEDEKEIPDDLLLCMKLAHEHGCIWLCLDDDGEIVPELPFHH